MSDPFEIASQFIFPSGIQTVEPYGDGIINDTYVVTFTQAAQSEHARLGKRAILQRINPQVFPDPPAIMHNLVLVLEHASKKSQNSAFDFVLPPIYKTIDDDYSIKDETGSYWRSLGFIENTMTLNVLQSTYQARQAGIGLGAFHQLIADLPAEQLKDTLPGFHDTPGYLRQFDDAVASAKAASQKVGDKYYDDCFEQIEKHRSLAGLLFDTQPALKPGIMHGDPKLNNILFDQQSGRAVSVIDLDTVKPGFIHYDIGDCIRSCCNRAGEMPLKIEEVQFSVSDFEAILQGYLDSAAQILSDQDFDLLYDVVRLLPFELGLRFFTDFLNGNRYFKVNKPEDNLYRAHVQFKLLESIESQEQAIRGIINRCRAIES